MRSLFTFDYDFCSHESLSIAIDPDEWQTEEFQIFLNEICHGIYL